MNAASTPRRCVPDPAGDEPPAGARPAGSDHLARSNDISTDGYVDIYLLPMPRAQRRRLRGAGDRSSQASPAQYAASRATASVATTTCGEVPEVGQDDLLTAAVVDFRSPSIATRSWRR